MNETMTQETKQDSYEGGKSAVSDEKVRTTMSVEEMRKLLGLGKTDAYWLVHKNCFETVLVNRNIRIDIESFEKWYANQIKHKKVNGPPPGEHLREISYSPQEVAELLDVTDDTIYTLIRKGRLPTFKVDTWMRIAKTDFKKWYESQNRYRLPEDREEDKKIIERTLSMPEAAHELGIPRKKIYWILNLKKNRGAFEILVVAGRKRITRDSFEAWYRSQDQYIKLCDRSEEEQREYYRRLAAEKDPIQPPVDLNKAAYSTKEAALLMDVSRGEVCRRIRDGELKAIQRGQQYRISREALRWWLDQWQEDREEEP